VLSGWARVAVETGKGRGGWWRPSCTRLSAQPAVALRAPFKNLYSYGLYVDIKASSVCCQRTLLQVASSMPSL
jgi:hypothetical protein